MTLNHVQLDTPMENFWAMVQTITETPYSTLRNLRPVFPPPSREGCEPDSTEQKAKARRQRS
jgi:hypothetical protein